MKKAVVVAMVSAATLIWSTGGARADVLNVVAGPAVVISPSPGGGYPGRAVAEAHCPEGQVRTGGGATVTAGNAGNNNSRADRYSLVASQPSSNEGWWAFGLNTDPSIPGTIQAYVICAKTSTETELTAP